MSTIRHDLRSAARLIIKNPGFSFIVVVTLALGIGLNTAVFSALDGILLRPLPGATRPAELVQIFRSWRGGSMFGSNSVPHYRDLRDRTTDVFDGVTGWSFIPMNLSVNGKPQRIIGQMVAANYFSVYGVSAERGRTFVPAEDSGKGAHPVVVLSHLGWVKLFGGDPAVVGKTMVIDGQAYTVVGVAPKDFKGGLPLATPLVWAPLTQADHLEPDAHRWENRGNNAFQVVGRLKPGVTPARVKARLETVQAELRQIYPDDYRDSGINLVPQKDAGIHPQFRSAQLGLSTVIMSVVLMLLLIACVNVANLMLARARDRAREMAVRLSLGAARSVLVRQLLTESLVLAVVAGAAGLLVAYWAIGIANRAVTGMTSFVDLTTDLSISPSVLGFALLVSLGTGVLFGLAPALQATRPDLIPALKGEAPAGNRRSRMSRGLVIAQMALSIVLLVSAGLFLRNLKAATELDKGFDSDNVLVADVDPGLQGYPRGRTEEFYRTIAQRMETRPGVKGVGLIDAMPLGLYQTDWNVGVPGYTPRPDESMSIYVATVSPGYFAASGTPIVKGRGFTVHDDSSAAKAIVVNQRFADRFWPNQDPIGRTVEVRGGIHTVIGVTSTGKYVRLGEDPTPFMYLAQAQHWTSGMSIIVRTAGDPALLTPSLREEVAAFDPDLPLAAVKAMNDRLSVVFLPARLAATVLGIFGMLGLVLASLGVYGVMSHTVAQRNREMGIRIAIGAAGSAVIRLVMRDGLTLVGIGIGIGMLGALAGAQLMSGVLYGSGLDPVTFVTVPLVLAAVAVLAIWVPARRAASVNPVVVLRQE